MPTFKYYLGYDKILMEHTDSIKNNKTYHLLEIDENRLHRIDRNLQIREVYTYKSNAGKWNASMRKEKIVTVSNVYSMDGYECVSREFNVSLVGDSLSSLYTSSAKSLKLIKIYCKLPFIRKYVKENKWLEFLSIYKEFDDNYNFLLKSHYLDEPDVPIGAYVDTIEEVVVNENFFNDFLSISTN